MARAITSVLGFVVVLFVLAWGALYVSMEAVRSWPEKTAVEGLSAPVEIAWADNQVPVVRAQSREDQLLALGYVHGLTRTWSVALWRQTAQGRLGEWFGAPADTLDNWARRLGWARRAEEAYQELTDPYRRDLRAYARGMNAAFEARTHRTPEFLLLELDPEPWQPWHTLAVEQLVAWIGAGDRRAGRDSSTQTRQIGELNANHQLRTWMRLHDFGHSAAWIVRDSSEVKLSQRQVYGSSALPLFEELIFEEETRETQVVSVPGTIMLPSGTNAFHTWTIFPTSSARIVSDTRPSTTSEPPRQNMHAVNRTGAEDVEASGRLYLSDRERLEWSGFSAATDIAAWMDLWRGRGHDISFELFEGSGLSMSRDGEVRILGNPPVVLESSRGVAVGQDQWIHRLEEVLEQRTSVSSPERSSRRTNSRALYSPWADSLRTWMIGAVHASETWRPPVREAMTYLRNWEGTFEGTSLGAAIFDTWLAVYADSTGHLPTMEVEASSRERILLYQTFNRAVDALQDRYGSDISRWRWERVQPSQQYFPIWSTPSVLPSHLVHMAEGKYAPVEPAAGGHPSTLRWGPSNLREGYYSASAVWEASVSTSAWPRTYVRKSDVPIDEFMQRFLVTYQYPRTFTMESTARTVHEVTLYPTSNH